MNNKRIFSLLSEEDKVQLIHHKDKREAYITIKDLRNLLYLDPIELPQLKAGPDNINDATPIDFGTTIINNTGDGIGVKIESNKMFPLKLIMNMKIKITKGKHYMY